MIINQILKNSNYKDTQFGQAEIDYVESKVEMKKVKGNDVAYINCLIRKKDVKLTPEEVIRQLFLRKLMTKYNYPAERIALESPIYFGREIKRADIVIWDKDRPTVAYIIVELKKPKLTDGKEQLKSYCNATGAPIGVWTNGSQISYYNRKDPNYFEDIRDIPSASETLLDIVSQRWTIEDLKENDRLQKDKISLKDIIKDLENEVLANAGVDVFEECFKLIFTKLYDEFLSGQNKGRYLEFTNAGRTDFSLKESAQELFEKAKRKWKGVFAEDSKILLSPSHLSVCVASLQTIKFFNSNLEVVDDAFEYLMSKSSKGEKGQYFTPRYVIDMCVKMMNPLETETIIDTACGSSGFPVHSIFHVWRQMAIDRNIKVSDLFSLDQKPFDFTEYVKEKVYGIDFDEKAVRVARTLNLIAGDGHTNVLHLNTLDYSRWDEFSKEKTWMKTYFEGFSRLQELQVDSKSYQDFNFDIVMANPPFAGDIKENQIISRYELGKNAKGKWQTKVSRDILFIERNLNFLKPGGRMAIVLPQGRFNNSTDKQIRDFIAERCRILAVVGLHGNTFKPHTSTKTSVLFVQKWDDELCPKVDDYNIFFATMQEKGKDNSGDKIYVKKDIVEIIDITSGVYTTVKYEKSELLAQHASLDEITRYRHKKAHDIIDGIKYREMSVEDRKEYEPRIWFDEYPENLLDAHGHLIVKHDLFNHEGRTNDGIAEAFIEFAKKEGLSFFQ
ncbi:MAG: N-6 DNA methylase [Faecalibacterium sp.]